MVTKKQTISILLAVCLCLMLTGISCKKNTNTNQVSNDNTNTAVENSNQETNVNLTTTNDNDQDPLAGLEQYDNKIVEFSSTDGKINGQIGIKLDDSGEYPLVKTVTFLKINDSLPQKQDAYENSGYHYAAHLAAEENVRSNHDGQIGATWCNKGESVDVLSSFDSLTDATLKYSECMTDPNSYQYTTETFHHIFASYFLASQFDYQTDILNRNKYYVFDYNDYIYEETYEGGYKGWGPNLDQDLAELPIVRTYDIEYSN